MTPPNKKSNSTIIHYKKNNLFYKMLASGFIFFEVTGQSVVTFYDGIIGIPEAFNRSLRRKNGFFFKINQAYLKWRHPSQYKNITIKTSTTTTTTTTASTTYDSSDTIATTATPQTDNIYTQDKDTTTQHNNNTTLPSPSSSSSSSTSSSSSSTKEQHLENELARLRAEFSKIMAAKSSASAAAPIVSSTPLPPPPPPPLPPVYKSTSLNIKKKGSSGVVGDEVNATPTKQPPQSLSIGDILRSGQKVQLKKSDVVRSPGGTPLRDTTNSKSSVLSTQDFIAMALKKKFQNVNVNDSPEVKKSGKKSTHDSFFSDSDDDFVDNPDDNKENKVIPSF